MPQYRYYSARRAGGKYFHEKSAFKAEIGDVYSGFSAKSPLPKLTGYQYRLVDTSTLEVEVLREQGLTASLAN